MTSSSNTLGAHCSSNRSLTSTMGSATAATTTTAASSCFDCSNGVANAANVVDVVGINNAATISWLANTFSNVFSVMVQWLVQVKNYIFLPYFCIPQSDTTNNSSNCIVNSVTTSTDNTSVEIIMDLLRSHLLSPDEQHEATNLADHSNSSHPQRQHYHHGIANDKLVLIYSLELNGFNKSKLFRCEKYNRIRFVLAPSLFGRNVFLFTNYCGDYTQFDRFEVYL